MPSGTEVPSRSPRSSSAGLESVSRKNQPSPSGAVFTRSGVSASAPLASVTVPDTGAYGSALLGYHLYTWALVAFVVLIAFAGLMLFIEAQFVEGVREVRPTAGAQALAWLFVLIVLANAVSTLLECGFGPCPDNPTGYELLQK